MPAGMPQPQNLISTVGHPLTQPVNKALKQSVGPINQSINQSSVGHFNLSPNQLVNKSVSELSVSLPVRRCHWVEQSVG